MFLKIRETKDFWRPRGCIYRKVLGSDKGQQLKNYMRMLIDCMKNWINCHALVALVELMIKYQVKNNLFRKKILV